MNQTENLEYFIGLWCIFPVPPISNVSQLEGVKIYLVEEVGVRFGGIPYIRFQPEHDHTRVIEVLGAWTISKVKI
jgi:hypothetical protein